MVSLDRYEYHLPEAQIAREPASPRESARLFVYDTRTDTISHDTFAHIGDYLPHPSLLLFNDTQVVPARVWMTKPTGGKIEVLFLVNEPRTEDTLIKGIVDRKVDVGATLLFPNGEKIVVEKQEEQFFFFRTPHAFSDFLSLLYACGQTPIPPYIKGTSLDEAHLREEYQSVLATHPASVAAPTASLHFSQTLLQSLAHSDVRSATLTLHVGAGTFAPITDDTLRAGKLFREQYALSAQTASQLTDAYTRGIPVIPVGTTAMRTLETVHRDTPTTALHHTRGETDIFIYPPFDFRGTQHFITNFHVPKSSLMLLVDAFLQHKKAQRDILALYQEALLHQYRFYSFGDGMLIL